MKKRQRGFTLIEIMTALGIVALIGAVSVPLLSRLQRSQRFRATAREMASELMRAKNLAGSGKRDTVTWVATDRTVQAGLRVQSTNTYSVFVDRDTINDGDELMVRAITLPYRMEIVSPAPGEEIRFRPNGTAVVPLTFTVRDRVTNTTRTVVVSGGGSIRII